LGSKKGFRAFWQASLRAAESVNHGIWRFYYLPQSWTGGLPVFCVSFLDENDICGTAKFLFYFLQMVIVGIDYFLNNSAIRPFFNGINY
jgi:hypothetical protein